MLIFKGSDFLKRFEHSVKMKDGQEKDIANQMNGIGSSSYKTIQKSQCCKAEQKDNEVSLI